MCEACYSRHRREDAKPKRPRLPVGWEADAACGGDLGWFERDQSECLAVCHDCPVVGWCRMHAEHDPEAEGVWGGQVWREGRVIA